jgi:hypothetical protein
MEFCLLVCRPPPFIAERRLPVAINLQAVPLARYPKRATRLASYPQTRNASVEELIRVRLDCRQAYPNWSNFRWSQAYYQDRHQKRTYLPAYRSPAANRDEPLNIRSTRKTLSPATLFTLRSPKLPLLTVTANDTRTRFNHAVGKTTSILPSPVQHLVTVDENSR